MTELLGKMVGHLEVVSMLRVGRYAGQSCTYWMARCHLCDRLEEYPQVLLTHPTKRVTCCPVCRRGPCLVCGSEILSGRSTTRFCSDFCRRTRKADLQAYRDGQEVMMNPKFWHERYKEVLQQRQEDPEINERYLIRQREAKREEYNDPVKKAKIIDRSSARYWANREQIRLYDNERRRQKALAELLNVGQKLTEIDSNDNE